MRSAELRFWHPACIVHCAIARFFVPREDQAPKQGLVKALGQWRGQTRGRMSTAVQNLNANSTNRQFATEATANPKDLLESVPWLPCTLSVEVPVVRFTIADLLGLKEGVIVETGCGYTSDLPLRVNRMLIGWTEFEVVGERLAVRITEQI